MKMKKNVIYLSILFVAAFFVSCSDNYLDVNSDGNSPTLDVLTPDLILPDAQYWSAEVLQRNRYTNNFGNMMMVNWSQSDGFSWYNDEFLYNVTSSFYSQIWDRTYVNALKAYRVLQSFEGPAYDNYRAIGKIMESYHFQILVDIYGDIPYSQALQRGDNPTPAYDSAASVYAGIVAELDLAMAMISNASAAALVPGTDDFTYSGDMDMWMKFANTVKLRVLVRQSDVGTLNSEFAGMTGVGFIDSDVVVQPGYAVAVGQQNPMWNAFGADTEGTLTNNNNATCASPTVLDHLMNTNDPRIDFIYEEPGTGHLGVVQGLLDYDSPIVDQFDPMFVSNIGPGILKSGSMDAVIFTASDSYFLQAEAMMKTLLPGNAKTAYEAGITASFAYLGAPSAAAYIGQNMNLVSWDNSPNKMEAIMTQKWTALNGVDAIQSWFDYNRTGYPSGLPVPLTATSADRPVRLFYPSSEVTTNNANVPTQPNAFTSKIFWAN